MSDSTVSGALALDGANRFELGELIEGDVDDRDPVGIGDDMHAFGAQVIGGPRVPYVHIHMKIRRPVGQLGSHLLDVVAERGVDFAHRVPPSVSLAVAEKSPL
jgi:hypothetical protein